MAGVIIGALAAIFSGVIAWVFINRKKKQVMLTEHKNGNVNDQ